MQPAENHYIKAIKSPSTCLLRKNSPKQYIRPTINGNLRGLHDGENVAWGYWGRLRIPTETNKPKPNGKKITPEIRQFLAKGAAKNWYFHKRWLNRKTQLQFFWIIFSWWVDLFLHFCLWGKCIICIKIFNSTWQDVRVRHVDIVNQQLQMMWAGNHIGYPNSWFEYGWHFLKHNRESSGSSQFPL